MPTTLDQIVEETRKLPPEQLPKLIERITLAAHGPVDPKVWQVWADTAMRRLAKLENGKAQPIRSHIPSARIQTIVGQ